MWCYFKRKQIGKSNLKYFLKLMFLLKYLVINIDAILLFKYNLNYKLDSSLFDSTDFTREFIY